MQLTKADLISAGRRTAEEIFADVYKVPILKALDPTKPKDFLVIVRRLERELLGVVAKDEGKALKAFLQTADVNWKNLDDEQKDLILGEANRVFAINAAKAAPKVVQTLATKAEGLTIDSVRGAARKSRIIDPKKATLELDQRVLRFASSSQANYVTDEYGRRSEAASSLARKIVDSGLERGLSSADIGAEMQAALEAQQLGRSASYYSGIANNFVARARTYGELVAYKSAGIARYQFLAVMDTRTSAQCRFLNGRQFEVKTALAGYKATVAGGPESIKYEQPWIGANKNQLYVKDQDGNKIEIAQIEDSGVGRMDDPGSFTPSISDIEIAAYGFVPPCHFRCRSTLIPVVLAVLLALGCTAMDLHSVLALVEPEQIGSVMQVITEAVHNTFKNDGKAPESLKTSEVQERTEQALEIFKILRGDLHWSLPRVYDHLETYLRCEVAGIAWNPSTKPRWTGS